MPSALRGPGSSLRRCEASCHSRSATSEACCAARSSAAQRALRSCSSSAFSAAAAFWCATCSRPRLWNSTRRSPSCFSRCACTESRTAAAACSAFRRSISLRCSVTCGGGGGAGGRSRPAGALGGGGDERRRGQARGRCGAAACQHGVLGAVHFQSPQVFGQQRLLSR